MLGSMHRYQTSMLLSANGISSALVKQQRKQRGIKKAAPGIEVNNGVYVFFSYMM